MYAVGKFLMVILGFLLLVLTLLMNAENEKEEKNKLISDNYERGYIDACKDFHRGKLKYELVKNDDGTVEWKRIKEDKNN
jgi:hypothetical protein